MSNDVFNLRIGLWHIHIMRERPWVRLGRNDSIRGSENFSGAKCPDLLEGMMTLDPIMHLTPQIQRVVYPGI